jgi:two-component system response regulator YesN
VFLNTLNNLHSEFPGKLLVIDSKNRIVSSPVDGLNAELIAEGIGPGAIYKDVLELNGEKYMLIGEKIASGGWTLLQLTPFDSYNQTMADAIRQAVVTMLTVLAIGVGLSFLFASILYDPWRRLAERLQGYVNKTAAETTRDAYTVVDSAIGNIIATIRQNEPIVREHLVHDLLNNHSPDDQGFPDRFRETGIHFRYPHYAVLVIEDEALAQAGKNAPNNLYTFSLIEDILRSRFAAAGTLLERGRFGFIINFDSRSFDSELEALLDNCCRDIQRAARTHSAQAVLSFYISAIHPMDRLHEAYEVVKRTIAYKAFIPAADVHFIDETKEFVHFEYPAAYQKLIWNTILAGNRSQSEEYVVKLFDEYVQKSSYPYPKLLQMFVMLMSHVLSSLVQEGYDIGPLMDKVDLFHLQNCQNRLELQSLILKQIGYIIDHLEKARNKEETYGVFVQQAIAYMEEHYADNLSISDIATFIGISTSHLSRVFKAEVGKTPLEFLTEFRLGVSKQLLKDKNKPLQQISQLIGYNDVRFFKKVEGMTPGEYRKKVMEHF